MDPRTFCSQSRVLIVAGKGGVGKTAVAAALGRMAAGAGRRTLLVDVEGTASLAALFGRSEALDYDPVTLWSGASELVGRAVRPDAALVEYLDGHGLRRVSRRMSTTGTLDLVATAIPGIKDILVLGKVKQLDQAGEFDLIVVDAPAAGHAVTFLSSARGLLDAAAAGPIHKQATDVIELLTDPSRCQVVLVTMPEETPVNEAVETAFHLEDRAGVALAPIVVNGIYEPLDLPAGEGGPLGEAAEFRRRRQELQAAQLERLARRLPLPQLRLPFVWKTDLDAGDVDLLAGALAEVVAGLPAAGAR